MNKEFTTHFYKSAVYGHKAETLAPIADDVAHMGVSGESGMIRITRPATPGETEAGVNMLRRLPYPYENLRVVKHK